MDHDGVYVSFRSALISQPISANEVLPVKQNPNLWDHDFLKQKRVFANLRDVKVDDRPPRKTADDSKATVGNMEKRIHIGWQP